MSLPQRNQRQNRRQRNLAPVQLQWTVETVRAFGWQSKMAQQQTLQTDMARGLQAMENTVFPAGVADQRDTIDRKGGRHWQRYVADLKGVERGQPPRDPRMLAQLRQSTQAYLDHFDQDYSKREQRSSTNQQKRQACLDTLAQLAKYDARDQFAALGDPPWDSDKSMQAASLKATLDIGSTPNGQIEKLGGDGVNPAFWVNRSGTRGGTAKSFLFKPEAPSVNTGIGGLPPGGEVAREALVGRASDLISGMTGIDFKMPETHVVSLERGTFPPGSLDNTDFAEGNGPVHGSLQSFAPTEGELRDQSSSVLGKIGPESCQTIAVLDTISLNLDRHSGNLMVNGGGTDTPEVVPIDHGLSFPGRATLPDIAGNLGDDKNVLLKLKGSYEPFSPEMLRKIGQIDPDLLSGALTQEIGTIERAHPQTQGKVGPDSVQISRRAAMFLKQAAGSLPPAILQVALGQGATELLDPDIDDQEFARRAGQAIQQAQGDAGAIKEFFLLMSDEERAAMRTALGDNGWPQENGVLNQKWMMKNLKLALNLYKNDTRNPTMAKEAARWTDPQDMQQRLSQGMPFVKFYAQVVVPAMQRGARPFDLDETSAATAREVLRAFPRTKVKPEPANEKEREELRDTLGRWQEYQNLGGSDALDRAIALLHLAPTHVAAQRADLIDALAPMRQAAALGSLPPQEDDTDDTKAKMKTLAYVEDLIGVLPQNAQAPFLQRLTALRRSVTTDPFMLGRIANVKEYHKDEIATLKADVIDAARDGLVNQTDDLVRQLRGPLRVTEDMYGSSVAGVRAQIRAGNLRDAARQIAGLKRAFGAQ